MGTVTNLTATGFGMSAGELEDMVRRELPSGDSTSSKEIYDLFNEAQNEISRRYDIPKKRLTGINLPIGGRVGLGSQVASHKSMTLTDSNGKGYTIYSAQEAASARPKWREETTGGYAVLDLANPSSMADGELTIRPYVDDPSLEFYFSLAVKPLPITSSEHQPFAVDINGVRSDGAIPEFHVMLAHFALFRLFNRLANKATSEMWMQHYNKQAMMFYGAYEKAKADLYGYTDPPYIYPKVKK